MARATILVVEDDPEIRELLEHALGKEGWTIVAAADGETGLGLLRSANPDCLVLDIMLPGMDGLEVLRRVKAEAAWTRLPVIMTTAKGEDTDVVSGLELGADDYVVKPYSPKVLIARIRAALRRGAEPANQPSREASRLERGPFIVDRARHEAFRGEERLELTATEFGILEFLMRDPGRVYSRAQIIDAVRGKDYPVTDRAVDVQILQLRKKLGEAGDWIETVRGVGYRLRDEA